jgi:hypothetical protein
LDLISKKKKTKLLADYQAYTRLYYEARIKDVVDEKWLNERASILAKIAEGEALKEPPEAAPLWFRNIIARRQLSSETEDMKEEVEKYRQPLADDSPKDILDEGIDSEEAKRVATTKTRAE